MYAKNKNKSPNDKTNSNFTKTTKKNKSLLLTREDVVGNYVVK